MNVMNLSLEVSSTPPNCIGVGWSCNGWRHLLSEAPPEELLCSFWGLCLPQKPSELDL